MLIFDEDTRPIMLDSIVAPTLTESMWVLDLQMMDFTLAPLNFLEEVVSPALELRIRGFAFFLPTSWNVLIYAEDTSQLDVIEIKHTAGREFTALSIDVGRNDAFKHEPGLITATDYSQESTMIAPSLGKHQMLCHPIGPRSWVCVAPSNSYNKYFKDTVIGDIL